MEQTSIRDFKAKKDSQKHDNCQPTNDNLRNKAPLRQPAVVTESSFKGLFLVNPRVSSGARKKDSPISDRLRQIHSESGAANRRDQFCLALLRSHALCLEPAASSFTIPFAVPSCLPYGRTPHSPLPARALCRTPVSTRPWLWRPATPIPRTPGGGR